MRAAVQVVLKENMIPLFDRREQGGHDGCHSRAKNNAFLAVFQGGHLLGDRQLVGGVEIARVEHLGLIVVCRRRIDRGNHSMVERVAVGAGMNAEGELGGPGFCHGGKVNRRKK